MILPVAFLVVVASVPLFGGQLMRVADIRVRGFWAALSSVVLQIGIINVFHRVIPHTLASAIHLFTYGLAGWFVLVNLRRVSGLWILTLGGLLNVLAIATNGGVMPASPAAARIAGMVTDPKDFDNSVPTDDAPLWFLGDVFAIPKGVPLANVFSIGDVLLVAGMGVVLHRACGSRRPNRRRMPGTAGVPEAAPAQVLHATGPAWTMMPVTSAGVQSQLGARHRSRPSFGAVSASCKTSTRGRFTTEGIDGQLLSNVIADLEALVPAVPADRIAKRLEGAVAALRAVDAANATEPARRLLAHASMYAHLFRVNGCETEASIGPVPAELDGERADLLIYALSVIAGNVSSHARASRIGICLLTSDRMIALTFGDDGCGFDVGDLEHVHMVERSLNVLQARLAAFEGSLTVESDPSRGSWLQVCIPWETEALATPRWA